MTAALKGKGESFVSFLKSCCGARMFRGLAARQLIKCSPRSCALACKGAAKDFDFNLGGEGKG